jgi:glutaredoxin-related protein
MDIPKLFADKIAPSAAEVLARFHRDVVDRVSAAVSKDHVVVVGMAQNPYVKKAREHLDHEGIPFTYIEYGSYFSKWKERLALKLWAGFPTFPMVFVDGTLVGGYSEVAKLTADGKLKKS